MRSTAAFFWSLLAILRHSAVSALFVGTLRVECRTRCLFLLLHRFMALMLVLFRLVGSALVAGGHPASLEWTVAKLDCAWTAWTGGRGATQHVWQVHETSVERYDT